MVREENYTHLGPSMLHCFLKSTIQEQPLKMLPPQALQYGHLLLYMHSTAQNCKAGCQRYEQMHVAMLPLVQNTQLLTSLHMTLADT